MRMLNTRQLIIDALCGHLTDSYRDSYGQLAPEVPSVATWAARSVLGIIAGSNALYHDLDHTVLVTGVGLEILRGRQIREGQVSPGDWLNAVVSLLCHDIGYVAGVCQTDRRPEYDDGVGGRITLPPGHTDAALAPWHVSRGQQFIRQRFAGSPLLDVEQICANIERTRFPVPEDGDHLGTTDVPGLIRAADLIGQLSDPDYLHRLPALFFEFQEQGVSDRLGYTTPDDLRTAYPGFFWGVAYRFIAPALEYLSLTPSGRPWVGNLYANVFAAEHGLPR